MTVAGTVLVLAAGGLGLGIGYALVTGDAGAIGVRVAALPTCPPCWCSRVPGCWYGVAPRAASLAWLGLLWCVVVLFGEVFRLPQWVQEVSPFEHLALVPAEDFRGRLSWCGRPGGGAECRGPDRLPQA